MNCEKKGLISVIVPIYKTEQYLERCIESVLNQTYAKLEIILVNDGSPDRCGEICDTYAKLDSRIKVIHKTNGGLSDARNAGLEIASGEYIGFVDSDDYIDKEMYEYLYKKCIEYSSKIACCGRNDIYENADLNREYFELQQIQEWGTEEAISRALKWDKIDFSVCDKLFSYDIINDLRFPLGETSEDVLVCLELICRSEKVVHVGKALYNYCHRMDSITTEKFTYRKIDVLEHAKFIEKKLGKEYPRLKNEIQSFFCVEVSWAMILFWKTKKEYIHDREKVAYKKYKKALSQHFFLWIKNPEISFREKLDLILLQTNLFPTIRLCKRIIKREQLYE